MAGVAPDPAKSPPAAIEPRGMGTPGYRAKPTSELRLNRLRARVALALLNGTGEGPVAEAVAFLRDVVAGRVRVDPRVQTAAAGALLKAGTAMASQSSGAGGSQIDARSVTVVVGDARRETLDAADRLLASLGGGEPGGPGVELDGGAVRPIPPAHPVPLEADRNGYHGNGTA